MSTRLSLGLAVWIAVLVAASYAQVLDYGPTGSDTLLLWAQARVESVADFAGLLAESTTDGAKGRDSFFYRPVHMAILAGQRALFGLDAGGAHALALLLHAGCAWAAGTVARRGARRLGLASRGEVCAFAAAGLFLIHPISIEVVPSNARSADLFHALFLLLALLAVDRDRLDRARDLAPALVWFALALGTKEHGVVLLGPMLAWLVFVRADLGHERARIGAKLTLGCAVITLLFVVVRRTVLGEWTGGYARPESWQEPTLFVLKSIGFDLLVPRLAGPWVEAWPRLGALLWPDALAMAALVALAWGAAWWRLRAREGPALRWAGFTTAALLAYALFCIAGKVYAPRLAYPLAALLTVGLAPALAGLLRTPRAGTSRAAALAGRIALAALALLWLAQSPLLLRDREWRSSGDANRLLTEGLRETWSSLPRGARVHLVNTPVAFTFDPGRANWAWRMSTTNGPYYFTLQGWLDDQLPERDLRLSQFGVDHYGAPFASYRHEAVLEPGRVRFRLPPTRRPWDFGPFPEWIIPGLASQRLDGSERALRAHAAGPGRASITWESDQPPPADHYLLIVDGQAPLFVPLAALWIRETVER